MPRKVVVERSTRAGKKYAARFEAGPTVHFGAKGMSDYTQHHDPARRANYIARHRANEDWTDKESAGFWARHLLWEATSLKEAAARLRSRGLQVQLKV